MLLSADGGGGRCCCALDRSFVEERTSRPSGQQQGRVPRVLAIAWQCSSFCKWPFGLGSGCNGGSGSSGWPSCRHPNFDTRASPMTKRMIKLPWSMSRKLGTQPHRPHGSCLMPCGSPCPLQAIRLPLGAVRWVSLSSVKKISEDQTFRNLIISRRRISSFLFSSSGYK